MQAADRFGNTALHKAAAWGNIETMEELIAAGASVDAKTKVRSTPQASRAAESATMHRRFCAFQAQR